MKIAKEGYPTIALVGTVVGLICLCSWLYLPSWMFIALSILLLPIWLLSIYFFRDPERYLPPNITQEHILSPADGKVVIVKEIEESEYLKSDAIQISIFLSPLNVHINRNPVSGIIKYYKYHKGKYLVAWHPKSSTKNERTTTVIENKKATVLIRQIAGFVARRVINYSKVGSSVKQSDQLGFIKFGSRADLFLPLNFKPSISINQKTIAGETVIGKLG